MAKASAARPSRTHASSGAGQRPPRRPAPLLATLLLPVVAGAVAHAGGRIHPASDLDLSDHRGAPLVVHFWATWCAPCMEEMPALTRFYHEVYPRLRTRGAGLTMLLVSHDVRRKDLQEFMAERDRPFPVFFDPYGHLAEALSVPAVPATIVLDAEGNVLERRLGTEDWGGPEWRRRLQSLVAEASRRRDRD